MTQPLRALLVEDSADDVELLVRELTRAGFDPAWKRVESRDGAAAALASQAWNVVLCDYSVPGFGLAGMLELLRETEKDIPCVVVSGAIPKEEAVAAMRDGAADYIFKSDLARLGPCIERELREADSRRAALEQLVLLPEAIERSNDVVLVLECRREGLSARRRWCAGSIPCWGFCRRTTSLTWPRRSGSSNRSASASSGPRGSRTGGGSARAWPPLGCPSTYHRDSLHRGLAKLVQGIIHECNLEPASLELEITESVVTNDIESALRTLLEFRQMGVRLSLDDFGTGYSSLSLLKTCPIDALKIDRSFVQQISVDPYDKAIAETIITLGHSLKLTVIAEGVETRAQLILLRHIGCDEMQGFYFRRAVPPVNFDALLQKRLT